MGPNYSIRTRSRAKKATRSSTNKALKIKTKQTLITSSPQQQQQQVLLQNPPSKPSPFANNKNDIIHDDEFPKTEGIVFEANDDNSNNNNMNVTICSSATNSSISSSINNGCSTPKGDKYRIPEIVNCPPAPKKRRVEAANCSVKRSPIAFFAPPELELFFYFALRGISV